MVQESTMICVDNSEWMRNGDFVPTRLQCEQEAANLIMQCKLRANPENAVGLLSMANTVEVLSTMTQENGKLFMKLHQIEPKGESKFLTAIKVAHLALKHRQNRNHKMRIILFIGSPIDHVDTNELIKLAKKLKKEKVQVDVICFGEADAENSEIMGRFVETLNGRDSNNGGSNLVVVSSGSTLTEALLSSAICRGEDGTAAPVVTASGGGFEFGIDPEDDPDLALALRVSLEEQRQRLQQEAAAAAAANDGASDVTQPMDTTTTTTQDVMTMDPATMSEEQQLEWALRMSMQDGGGGGAAAVAAGGTSVTTTTTTGATTTITTTTTTSASAKPLNITAANIATQQHSVQIDSSTLKQTDVKCKPDSEANNNNSSGSSSNNNKSQPQPQSQSQNMATTDDDQLGQLMSDPELLRQLVADLPGVDPNSQEIQDAVNSATEHAAQKESSQKEEQEDNDDGANNNNNDK